MPEDVNETELTYFQYNLQDIEGINDRIEISNQLVRNKLSRVAYFALVSRILMFLNVAKIVSKV